MNVIMCVNNLNQRMSPLNSVPNVLFYCGTKQHTCCDVQLGSDGHPECDHVSGYRVRTVYTELLGGRSRHPEGLGGFVNTAHPNEG